METMDCLYKNGKPILGRSHFSGLLPVVGWPTLNVVAVTGDRPDPTTFLLLYDGGVEVEVECLRRHGDAGTVTPI